MTSKHRPRCEKMGCEWMSDAVLYLPVFGPVYFCASHALWNYIETSKETV
jgi:hypothetical protein